jgi:hypothetical protein
MVVGREGSNLRMAESKSDSISSNINTFSEFQRESAARDINYIAAGSERKALSARPILLSYNWLAGAE